MGKLAQRFPERISYGAIGGPTYVTRVKQTVSGKEKRNQTIEVAIHVFNVSRGIKTEDDARVADAHYRKAKGKAHSFPFKDWTDFRLAFADSRLVAVDASTTVFQLCKVYGADEAEFEEVRRIRRPISGTLVVKQNGTTLVQGSGAGKYQVDLDTGRVTFGTAPGAATLTASCEFDLWMRYDFDAKKAAVEDRNPSVGYLIRWENIDLREVDDDDE